MYIHRLFISNDMLSHLFLLQNLSSAWAYSTNLNPLLWSMSTEWWVYFIFVLVLLPMWRRIGVIGAACASIVLGIVPTAVSLLGWPSLAGFPHLLGAFGLGMVSAALLHTSGNTLHSHRCRTFVGVMGGLAFVAFSCIAIAAPSIRLEYSTRWITDVLLATACAALIFMMVSAGSLEYQAKKLIHVVVRILESRPLVWLGRISYSLYLTHLVTWAMIGITLGLPPIKRVVNLSLDPLPVRVLVLIPLLVLSAYGFYLLFEKPFLHYREAGTCDRSR